MLALRLLPFLIAGCLGCSPSVGGGTRGAALDLAPSRARALDAALARRLRASAHAYFRFVNSGFANRVCDRAAHLANRAPDVNLHGDAHVEQYAITDGGRGLVDFDDATVGPPIIDLVRFATSLVLSCRERGFDEERRMLDAFFRGYEQTLQSHERAPFEPRIVRRLRAASAATHGGGFAGLAAMLSPLSERERAQLLAAFEPYARRQLELDPTLSPQHFQVTRVGRLRLGIGSAGLNKFVLRVRGPTEAPEDDDVIEVKEMGDLSSIRCLHQDSSPGATRILTAQARIAYEPYRLADSLWLAGRWYWVHAWAKSYRELRIADFADVSELSEIAYDVGMQLGLGHPKLAQDDSSLRVALLALVRESREELSELSRSMADETIAAWRRFQRQ